MDRWTIDFHSFAAPFKHTWHC